jgi:peptidoglycan/LPS O-acetylase OafA/YrhL
MENRTLQFRKDINGLRAIAVIAVVLFHFNASWLPGGFAGVDVFFVISGFLMTSIIFKGLELETFSILKFYVARANRIIPALAGLCLVLLCFGVFWLAPVEFKTLGKHIASSITFISNIIFWRESGYFDAESHGKWLLHTWSLSVEWQFYIVYPIILVVMKKLLSFKKLKLLVLIGTITGLVFSIILTYKWPNAAYYLLPTRAWEMMLGGVAYLYPFNIRNNRKLYIEWVGISLIIGSYFFITKGTPWPGYLALFPVMGSFLVIQSQRHNSIITGNAFMQRIGTWSYSIYLWHWPLVVGIYYFSLDVVFTFLGVFLSILLGFLSYKYVEKIRFKNDFVGLLEFLKLKPIYMLIVVGALGSIVFIENGYIDRATNDYKALVKSAEPSPFRQKCHINNYQTPGLSCEYFGSNITWAVLGDSHTVEIAYALAEKLKVNDIGLKHFSFSSCPSSYREVNSYNKCSRWYNESLDYILKDKKIKSVLLNHRFTSDLFGGDAAGYPKIEEQILTDEVMRRTKNIDNVINVLAKNKDNVYIFYPIPELTRNVNKLIGLAYKNHSSLLNIINTDLNWYNQRNKFMIHHFENAKYPKNVHLLKPSDLFCDEKSCFAVKNGIPLYFDDDHPSVAGATILVGLIE